MSSELLASKIVILEEPPRVISVPALPTAVLAIEGIAERGPVNDPQLLTSFEEYVNIFGGFTADADMTLAANGYFENGGQFMVVNRVVHYSDILSAATKQSQVATLTLLSASAAATTGAVTGTLTAPFNLEPADTLDVDIDGGGPATATFNATAGTVTSGNSEPFTIGTGDDLQVEVDGGIAQTIIIQSGEVTDGAATAVEVAAVLTAGLTGATATDSAGDVVITSDSRGTASSIQVIGGTMNSAGMTPLAFVTSLNSGTGNVADIDAVTIAEVKTIVELAVAGSLVTDVNNFAKIESTTTGTASTVQVVVTSTADDELGLDNILHQGTDAGTQNVGTINGKTDGTYANTISIVIAAATSGDATEFNLSVEDDGIILEIFPNISATDSTATNFWETIINDADTGSLLVAVVDLDVALNPDAGTFGPMAGGKDGIAGGQDNRDFPAETALIGDIDFTGNKASALGLFAFDQTRGITLLAVPGQATSAIQNAMISYAEIDRERSVFAVLDPPENLSATGIVTYVESTANLLNASEQGAIYWPRVKILNPNQNVFGVSANITVAPSGIIAGVYARTDSSEEGGIFQPPAGVRRGRLIGVLDFETAETLDEAKRDIVFPKRINPLTSDVGLPPFIDGSRTLKGDGSFPSVARRRGASFIEQSIKGLLQFARQSRNTPELRAEVTRIAFTFLLQQLGVNAFASTDPNKAFKVDFGDGLNPPSVQLAGKLVGRIGLAFAVEAEFIILKFAQDLTALEQELQAAGL